MLMLSSILRACILQAVHVGSLSVYTAISVFPTNRHTDKKVKFRKAIIECLTSDSARYGPIVNLMRVAQLRKIRNPGADQHEKESGKVRVDAIKSEVKTFAKNIFGLKNYDLFGVSGKKSLSLSYVTRDERRLK